MFRRRKSIAERIGDFIPVVALVALGSASVVVGMNILVRVAPVAIGGSPSPSSTIPGHSFPVIPSYAIATDTPVQPPAVTESVPAARPTLLTKHISEHDPAGIWDVSIAYPAFLGGSTPFATDINDQIATVERAQADKFEAGPAAQRQQAGRVNHLQGTFAAELLTPRLASFTLSWTDDTIAGHVVITVSTITLDLATGQPVAFDDMFTDADAALQIMSGQASDSLYYQLGAAWDPTAAQLGTTPNHANFGNWALTRTGIKVTFDQFQVVNSDQTPSVVIPWSALAPVLVSSGPVADLAGPAIGATPGPTAGPTAAGPSPAQASPTVSAGPSGQ
jgi:hypothetical protein